MTGGGGGTRAEAAGPDRQTPNRGEASESGLIPLSALQHYVVCPRQAALIHIEQQWAENAETAQGRIEHERVDTPATRTREGTRRVTGLTLRSFALGVVGRADAVEFRGPKGRPTSAFPVEHKRGRPKRHDGDKVQLCAQALCLEEMLSIEVPAGALFYGQHKRRFDVAFDAALRARTQQVAADLHDLLAAGGTPAPVKCPACPKCSLRERCWPDHIAGGRGQVARYVQQCLHSGEADGDDA